MKEIKNNNKGKNEGFKYFPSPKKKEDKTRLLKIAA
jgi:hypothetical protein